VVMILSDSEGMISHQPFGLASAIDEYS